MKASLTLPANTLLFRPEGPQVGVVNSDGKISLRSDSIYLEVAAAQNAALGTERTSVRLRGQQLVTVAALIKSLGGGWQEKETDIGGS